MSVVGVDFGTLNTVIAVARNRGVDVITHLEPSDLQNSAHQIVNEVSNRTTPSLVGFGPKCRYIGESAKTQEVSNLKNTVSSLKRLLGRSTSDPELPLEQQFLTCPLVHIGANQVGAEVSYLGKKEKFSATQLAAMFLSKVKQTTANELKLPVSDIVLGIPPWFSDVQRRALLDAADIAGLKVLRLMHDTTAAALGYGITKLDLPVSPDDRPRRVAFVDLGHSDYTCSIVEFRKGELAVKATAFDRHFGGRNFDKALVDHLVAEFATKYKIDVRSSPKALARVFATAEKGKKILSANQQAPINIESLVNDIDCSTMVSRTDFDKMVAPLLGRVTLVLEQALAQARIGRDDIDVIEIVGGGARVPSVKERISQFFGKPLSYTLNQDEAVARGCAFSCAILSPVFKVRDFVVQDMLSYPIEFTWEKAPDIPDEDTSLTVFGKGNPLPSTKILTFYRKAAFDLEARYATASLHPDPAEEEAAAAALTAGGEDATAAAATAQANGTRLGPINTVPGGPSAAWIAGFSVKGIKADNGKDEFAICKLKARINIHGVLNLESGYTVADEEVDDDAAAAATPVVGASNGSAAAAAAEGEKKENADDKDKSPAGAGAAAATPAATTPKPAKTKKQVRKNDLHIVAATQSLDSPAKNAATELEAQMVMDDKLVADTEEKKNELETYIYDMREKLDTIYADLASDDEKDQLRAKLTETEDWLYDEGDDTTKAVYVSKIEEIRAKAGPITQRHHDKVEAERAAIQALVEAENAAKRAAAEEEARKAKEAQADAAAPEVTEPADKDEDMVDMTGADGDAPMEQ